MLLFKRPLTCLAVALACAIVTACGTDDTSTDLEQGAGGTANLDADVEQDAGTDSDARDGAAGSDASENDASVEPDSGADSAVDAAEDASEDVTEDVKLDAPQDSPVDAPKDSPVDAPKDSPADAPQEEAGPPTSIRIMAANLTSGNGQSYDAGHGQRIMQGLNPDIVLIQEFNYGNNDSSDIRRFVNETFGTSFHYYREPSGAIPNGVISRWPILSSGEWNDTHVNNRDFAWARIDIPGPRDLYAISVHLLTSNAGERSAEAREIVNYVQQYVPANSLVVVGGDFNTNSHTENVYSELGDLFRTSGPYPEDQFGNPNTNFSRSKPYDGVYASFALDNYEVPVRIGNNSFPNGLVFDSREYNPLSDVAPVQRNDSGASQMQHMAVVREFLVQ